VSNPNGSPISGFGALLYVNFIIKKKYRVDAIAKEMQVATDTLYRYIRGENLIPPDRIIDLIRATGDIDYLEFFCEPIGYLPVTKASGKISAASRDREVLNRSIIHGRAIDTIDRAFTAGAVTKKEYTEIHQHLTELQRAAAELDQKIKEEVC